ncbi:MAG: hypothetical protein GF401_03415 [Chitinivibrionales bacterium]|nr:hypothetical protein [Chitinivibrionales bacterium]
MKKLAVSLFLIFAVVSGVHAQDELLNLYASVGYGFPIGGRYVDSTYKYDSGNNPLTDEMDDHYLNIGRGIKLDIGAAYRVMENIDARLGLEYSGGVPSITKEVESIDGVGGTTTSKYKYSQFGIKLYAVPNFRIVELLDMYLGVGAGVFFNFTSMEIVRTTDGPDKYEAKVDFKNKPSFAFLGLIGANYPLNDFAWLFTEINFAAMNVTAKEREVESSDFPSNVNEDMRLTSGTVDIYEKGAHDRFAPVKTPASNFAIKAGIRFFVL